MATFDNIRKLMKMSKAEQDALAEPSIMDEVPTNPEQDELIELAKGRKEAIDNSLTNPTTGIVTKTQLPKVLANLKNPTREDLVSTISEGTPTTGGRSMLEMLQRMRDANEIVGLEEMGLSGKKLTKEALESGLRKQYPDVDKIAKVEFNKKLQNASGEDILGLADFDNKLISLRDLNASVGKHEFEHLRDYLKNPEFMSRRKNLLDRMYNKSSTIEGLDNIHRGHHMDAPYFELDDTVKTMRKLQGLTDTDEALEQLNSGRAKGTQEDIFKDKSVKGRSVEREPIAAMDIRPLIKKR